MNMPDLKPCPFCGGESSLSHDYEGMGASYVRCKKCGLESIKFLKSFGCASDDRAVEFWNRRAGADCNQQLRAIDAVPVVRCGKCVLHGKCFSESYFRFAGIENPFCCAGKRRGVQA